MTALLFTKDYELFAEQVTDVQAVRVERLELENAMQSADEESQKLVSF